MTLIELSPESGQLTHYLDEIALCLSIFELYLLFFKNFLGQSLL